MFDDSEFYLAHLETMNVSEDVIQRGSKYYFDNKVCYINLDGRMGYAIVAGTKPYEVEFEYTDGKITNLTCSCFCTYHCKHEVATMLQLREVLELIERNYREQYEETGYFAALDQGTLMKYVMNGKQSGSLSFG